MPEIIDSGFDIINPVQWNAFDMEAKALKKDFGKDIVFWGGGNNAQVTIAMGTPEEVRKEALEICEIFSKDGGFVFSSMHNVQSNTPIENVVALINAVKEFNGSI